MIELPARSMGAIYPLRALCPICRIPATRRKICEFYHTNERLKMWNYSLVSRKMSVGHDKI